jgi:arylsulfatase A-like enzyme
VNIDESFVSNPNRTRSSRPASVASRRHGLRHGAALALILFANTACGPTPPTRVVLIAVDTLRADHLGTYGAKPSPSPFLDARAKTGVVFEWTFATSPWTLPSFGSILTGLEPGAHEAGLILRNHPDRADERERVGPRSRFKLNLTVPTLAEQLSAAGLTTIALVQSPNLDPAFGLDRGFDTYEHHHADNERIVPADVVLSRALEVIDEHRDVPLFLLIHLFEPHLNYHAPPPFGGSLSGSASSAPPAPAQPLERTAETEPALHGQTLPVSGVQRLRRTSRSLSEQRKRFIRAAYDEEISFVDREIERFFAGLETRGIANESIVILTSDHGEEMFEHGGFEHGHSLYNEVLRVPLVVWQPNARPGRRSEPVSLIDIAPMILASVDAEIPAGLPGRSPFHEPASSRILVAEGTLVGAEKQMAIRWPHKLIREVGTGRIHLFDLAKDPGESHRLVDANLERTLTSALDTRLSGREPNQRSAPAELDPSTVEDLRALGYLE